MLFKLCVSLLCSLVLLCSLGFLATGCESKSGDGLTTAKANAPQTASASTSSSPSPASVNSAASPQPPAPSSASPATSSGYLAACALIEKSEIASVQGAPVQSEVPSTQAGNALAISQCYFTVASPDGSKNLSVHLEVIQADAKSPKAATEYWEKAFSSKGESDEAEKEASKPLPIPGVGEEAFWVGNTRAGALYALKKARIVRVSVGGPDDMKTKLEKSKTLIAKVLKRLG